MEAIGSILILILKVVAGVAVAAVVALPLMAAIAAIYGAIRRALGKDDRSIPPKPPLQQPPE
jgi:hypothetical protein